MAPIHVTGMLTYVWAPYIYTNNPGCTGATGTDLNGATCTAAEDYHVFFMSGDTFTGASPDGRIQHIKFTDATLTSFTNQAGASDAMDNTGVTTFDPSPWRNPTDGLYYMWHVNGSPCPNCLIQYSTASAIQGPYGSESSGD